MKALGSADIADLTGRLGQVLHAAGVAVTPERSGRLAAGLGLAAPITVPDLYWLARVTLVADFSQIEIFDRVFAQIFRGIVDPADFRGDQAEPPRADPADINPTQTTAGTRSAGGDPQHPTHVGDITSTDKGTRDLEALAIALSPEERLRHKDFASLTQDELAQLRAIAGRLAFATPHRASRRRVRRRHGAELDVRATMRKARRTGGEPLVAVRRGHRSRPRRLVLLCDISGSMESYARAYLQLLMSGVSGARAEAFVFATRLTRLTRTLRGVSPAVALQHAARAAPDWSGGTRIGDAIKAFNDGHGQRGTARGAVVVVLSDGWDSGDPDTLAREMARLRRLAYRIVWVNPRKAAEGYLPLVGGMAAALPHTDAFVSGHSLAALDEVLQAISATRGN
jgi:uncharacterized protein